MTNAFRKHHQTIMWIIIVGTILSLFYYLMPSSRNGGGGGGGGSTSVGTIDNVAVSEGEYEAALREAKILYRMRTGHWPTGADTQQQLEDVAFQQLFIVAKLKELNLAIPESQVDAFIRTDIFRIKPGEAMKKEQWDEFVQRELYSAGHVTVEDFENWSRNTLAVEMLLSKLYGVNGATITAKEAEFFFRRNHESMTVEWVRFPITNYTAGINPTAQEIGEFYTNNQATYRLPEREVLDYIHFEPTNYAKVADGFIAANTNFDEIIDKQYMSREPDAYKDADGKQLSAEAAKALLKLGARMQVMVNAAQTNAAQLKDALLEGHSATNNPLTRAELEKFAATNGLKLVTSVPFDEQNPPKDLQLTPQYMDSVFHLDTNDLADQYLLVPAAAATNGLYLVGLEKKLPSENQSLEAVRAKVIEDLRQQKAGEIAAQAGARFEAAAKAGLAKGESFDTICEAQHVKAQTLSPFSLETTSIPEIEEQNLFEYLARTVYDVPTGQVSEFNPNIPGGGFVAWVKQRTPVDEAVVQRDLPVYLQQQRVEREQAAFNIWFGRAFQLEVKRPQKPDSSTGAS